MFDASALARFDRDGYVVVRGLADASQVAALRTLAGQHLAARVSPLELEADTGYPGAPASRDAAGGDTVRRLLQAYARDSRLAAWATGPAIAGRLRQLLGPDVRLSQAHHNCIMTKNPAHSSVTGWHQDVRYWHFSRPELVSVWLALGAERAENGCLRFIPGSHRLDFDRERYDAALTFRTDLPANAPVLATAVDAELEAGDVVFFHARLLHAARRNETTVPKIAAVFTYHAADVHPLPGTRSASLPEIPLP